MSEGTATDKLLARAIQEGNAHEVISTRLKERGAEETATNLSTLEEAVATHVPREDLFSCLKASLQRPENGYLHEHVFVDATGQPTDRAHAERFQAGATGNAFYWTFDGDVEHIQAFMQPLPPAARAQVSTILGEQIKASEHVEQARSSIHTTLSNIFNNLLQSAGDNYDPMLTQMAKDLDAADVLNGVEEPGNYLQRLQDAYRTIALEELFTYGQPVGLQILSELGLDEHLDEEATRRINNGPAHLTLLRAAGLTGITAEAYDSLTIKHPETGRDVLDTPVWTLLSGHDKEDWQAARTLARRLDKMRAHDDESFPDRFEQDISFGALRKLCNLESHDTVAYGLAIQYGFARQAIWHAKRINEANGPNQDASLPTRPLDVHIFGPNPKNADSALTIADNLNFTSAYVRKCNQIIDLHFREGQILPLTTVIANHYDLHGKIVEHLCDLAKKEFVYVPGAHDLAKSFDQYAGTRTKLQDTLTTAYEEARFSEQVKHIIDENWPDN